MALWDNLGKKASETTAKAIQQAKILSETSRLNGLISDEEKKINNNYFQIGKLYTAIHRNDCEEDFAGMIAAIAESEQKIGDLRMQIQNLKGVIRCEKCGAELAKGVAFCSSCGAPIPRTETPDMEKFEKCGSCGAWVEKGMRFCTSCGKPMAPPAAITDAQSQPPAAEAPAPVPEKRVCPNCGAAAADDVLFCTECGTKL